MPHFRRIIRPGALVHIISVFEGRASYVADDIERTEYLARVGAAFMRGDWRMICYAIMSTHVHLAAVAGTLPFDELFRGAHSGYATWLNRKRGRKGHVFADRPDSPEVDLADVHRVVSYMHNNPVRAGVVRNAKASTWTSHRAYLGIEEAQRWLDVDLGLLLLGRENTLEDRNAFGKSIAEAVHDAEPPWLDRRAMAAHRRELRHELGVAIELTYPVVSRRRGTATYPILTDQGVRAKPGWIAGPGPVLDEICRHTGISLDVLQSSTRQRVVTRARKLAVLVYRQQFGCPLKEIAAWLGITGTAASRLASRIDVDVVTEAAEIANRLTVTSSADAKCSNVRKLSPSPKVVSNPK